MSQQRSVIVASSGPMTDETDDQMDDDHEAMGELVTAAGHADTPGAFVAVLNNGLTAAEFSELLSLVSATAAGEMCQCGCDEIVTLSWEATTQPNLFFTTWAAPEKLLVDSFPSAASMYNSSGLHAAFRMFEDARGWTRRALVLDKKVRLTNRFHAW